MVMLRLLSFIIEPVNLLTLNAHNTTEILQTRFSATVNQYSSTEINGASMIYSSSRSAPSIVPSDIRDSRGLLQ